MLCAVPQSYPTLATLWTSLPGSSVHGDSPGKNAGVGCHALLMYVLFGKQIYISICAAEASTDKQI